MLQFSGKISQFGAELIEPLVTDFKESKLIKVGVVETPALAQIVDEPVADDEAQGLLGLLQREPAEPRIAEILAEHSGILAIETQCAKHRVGERLLGEDALVRLQPADQTGSNQEQEDECDSWGSAS